VTSFQLPYVLHAESILLRCLWAWLSLTINEGNIARVGSGFRLKPSV
jgi:hypothetical protein